MAGDETEAAVHAGKKSRARAWLRAGLIVMAAQQVLVGAWAYFAPSSFYNDLPTVDLDPPFNEHFVSDVGSLDLALGVVVLFAMRSMDIRQIRAAVAGFFVYSATHVLFHITHLAGVGLRDAVSLMVALTLDALIPLALLVLAWRVPVQEADRQPVADTGLR